MLVRLRRSYGQWLTSGGYLLFLIVGSEVDTPLGWRISAGIIAVLALFAWVAVLRRARALADTPTSQIASAAQGYVELLGRGKPLGGPPLLAPLNHRPCLWYRYQVERKRDDKWVTESSGESSDSFLLDDGSGVCVVDPEGAEVLPRDKEVWHPATDYRYTQALLIEGESIYVLGGFRTLAGDGLQLSLAEDVRHLLAEWKKDMPQLLRRFDRNGDGTLDMYEWEHARAEARYAVERNHRELRAAPDTHMVGVPSDERLYLISSLPPEKVERNFVRWALFHVVVFLISLVGFGWQWIA